MGHLQRMQSLLWHLNNFDIINAYILLDNVPDGFPAELLQFVKHKIDFKPDLIIRDMRDSSEDEINELKNYSSVLTIDDNGKGDNLADFSISLLPNIKDVTRTESLGAEFFIFGYNFLSSLSALSNGQIERAIDFSIYSGFSPYNSDAGFIHSILPKKASYVILGGNEFYFMEPGKSPTLLKMPYAEILLSSKIVISHFGITFYEAAIAGCKILALNPSSYHSELCVSAQNLLNIENLGVIKDLDAELVSKKIVNIFNNIKNPPVRANAVYDKAIDNLNRFCEYVIDLID